MEPMLRVGVISTTHGLKGEVKIFPTTDSPERFKHIKRVVLKTPKKEIETEITSAKVFKNLAIVKFALYDSVEDVKGLHGTEVYIYREDGQPLEDGEYYIADLIGCSCFDDDGIYIGKVKDVLQTGANDVYAVDTSNAEAGYLADTDELLLPVIDECIKSVDIEQSRICIHMMPGLI